MRKIIIASLLLVPVASPAHAQAIANDRVLTIFGEDKCPENTICVRAPEAERYRIPKALRNSGPVAPQNQSWAARANDTINAGARTGTGSCSAVGGGGWTGCYMEQMRAARAEREAEAANAPVIEP